MARGTDGGKAKDDAQVGHHCWGMGRRSEGSRAIHVDLLGSADVVGDGHMSAELEKQGFVVTGDRTGGDGPGYTMQTR